jgi:hypothetical protein
MADEMLAPITEAAGEEEDAEFASDDHGDVVRRRGQLGRAWLRGFSKRMGLSLLAAHPKRRPDARPERDLAVDEFKLQIQRDIRRAIGNDGQWNNSFLNNDETAMRYVNTRQRTGESSATRAARDVQIAQEGNDKSCLALIARVTPSGERRARLWPPVVGPNLSSSAVRVGLVTRLRWGGSQSPPGWFQFDGGTKYEPQIDGGK